MCHTSDMCFMYGDLLWPDLDLEPSLVSSIYSISTLPYILGVFGISFGPKKDNFEVSTTRNLKAPILTFDLILTWHVTSFGNFWWCFRNVSSRAFERRVARLSAAIRSRVMTWGRLTPPPPPPASRGWRNTPATAGLMWFFCTQLFYYHYISETSARVLTRLFSSTCTGHCGATAASKRFGFFIPHLMTHPCIG